MRNPTAHWIILAYCFVLWLTNWSWSTDYDRDIGLTHSSIDLRGLGAILGMLVTVICVRRVWMLFREILDLSVRIPRQRRLLGDWGMLWYLVPLIISFGSQSHSTSIDGVLATSKFQYGGDVASIYSLVLSASAIMLFQTVVNLEAQRATLNTPMHPHGKAGRFEKDDRRSPPTDR
ncbi:hypothetical protein [Novipirellula caenicola]|uniref:Uncharacterized protein n=1 Tax=Novipirellula caenicola TaxID=1536901 RepID=A0ABP9VI30_9BACT